jgi:hypothetical protein
MSLFTPYRYGRSFGKKCQINLIFRAHIYEDTAGRHTTVTHTDIPVRSLLRSGLSAILTSFFLTFLRQIRINFTNPSSHFERNYAQEKHSAIPFFSDIFSHVIRCIRQCFTAITSVYIFMKFVFWIGRISSRI